MIVITPADPRPFAGLGFIMVEINNESEHARYWWQEPLRRDPLQSKVNDALKDLDGPKEKP